MKKMKTILILFLNLVMFVELLNATNIIVKQKDFENKTVYMDVNTYKVLEFKKRIKDVQVTNSDNIILEFMDNDTLPLQSVKVFARQTSNESAIITFTDNSFLSVKFNIIPNLSNLINLAKKKYPKLNVEQINDTIFLKGSVENEKDIKLIFDMFEKSAIDAEKVIVNLLSTSNPKMIRIKLYAIEIEKGKDIDLKNNWFMSRKNYRDLNGSNYPINNYPTPYGEATRYYTNQDGDRTKETYDQSLVNDPSSFYKVDNQRIAPVEDAIDDLMKNAVSLTGGLTAAANFLGKYFNAGLTINYLAKEGVANILDETTLITLENKEAVFHAGGTVYIKVTKRDSDGVTTELEPLDYGLKLTISAKEVMDNEFISLTTHVTSRELDWGNKVDGIPGFKDKSVKTSVIIKNTSTVILGGLINSRNSNADSKVPLLGDVPLLGFLFKSNATKDTKKELVFFITPEIVNASNNDQKDLLEKNKKTMLKKTYKNDKEMYLDAFNLNFKKKKDNASLQTTK